MQSLYRPAVGDPEGALVLLHGRGADERDLFPLLDMLDPDQRLLGATARGPLSLPPGGAHWYVVRRVGYPDPETFNATYPELAAWLDGVLAEHGIPPERTVLGGFSQGSVMSYALGLGPGRPRPAGILALSGFLPTVEGFELDLAKARDLPVAIGHGTQDPVITVDFGRDARDRLSAAGARVTYRESPMPHTIDPQYLRELQQTWLPETISAAAEQPADPVE
jgi:phospholipase/carboxylesterase